MFPLEKEFGLTELRQTCDNADTRIFGFIMYTRRHAFIAKTLRDTDFWYELDETSGPRWPIFAVRPLEPGSYRAPAPSRPGLTQMMVQTWVEPNENRKYLDLFSLDESRDLPCFVAFIWNDDDCIEQITCPLSNRSLQEAFDSIRTVVAVISDAECRVHSAYRKTQNVFRNVKADIEAHLARKKLSRTFEYFPYIRDFMSMFRK